MKVKIVVDDILNAPDDFTIVNQVNCKARMRSGVAKVLREEYPGLFDEYSLFIRKISIGGNTKRAYGTECSKVLGRCHLCAVWDRNLKHLRKVANVFGQDDYGYDGTQYTCMEALKDGLLELKAMGVGNLALPYKIASDRGGADWNEVLELLEAVFEDYPHEVVLYDKFGVSEL